MFLELLVTALYSSPIAYGTPPTCRPYLLMSYFLPFHTVHGVLATRIPEWVVISSSSGPCFVTTLHYDLSIFGGLASRTGRLTLLFCINAVGIMIRTVFIYNAANPESWRGKINTSCPSFGCTIKRLGWKPFFWIGSTDALSLIQELFCQ